MKFLSFSYIKLSISRNSLSSGLTNFKLRLRLFIKFNRFDLEEYRVTKLSRLVSGAFKKSMLKDCRGSYDWFGDVTCNKLVI